MTDPQHFGFEQLVNRIDPHATLVRTWPLTGGISAEVTALELALPGGRTCKMVVRRHGPADLADNPNIAADEFRLLELLAASDVAAPEPIFVDNAGEFLGSPCIVIAFVEGEPDFAPTDIAGLVVQYAGHLARIHGISGDSPEIAFLPARAARVAVILRNRPPIPDETLQESRIRDRLDSVWPLPDRNPHVLLHGDFWPGNVLCVDGRVNAIIDWEDASRGDPLVDVANARMEILWTYGADAMHAFTAAYLMQTHADPTHLPYWDLVAALRPAGKLSAWASNAEAEQNMRECHAEFVAQAFSRLA